MFSMNIFACDRLGMFVLPPEINHIISDKVIQVRQDTKLGSVNCSFYRNLFLENIPATMYFAIRMGECVVHTTT